MDCVCIDSVDILNIFDTGKYFVTSGYIYNRVHVIRKLKTILEKNKEKPQNDEWKGMLYITTGKIRYGKITILT